MRGPGMCALAAVLLPLALPAAGSAGDAELEKYVLTDGRSFIGTFSAAEGVMTIPTVNGTLSFALTATAIASHRPAEAAELAALAAAPDASTAAGAPPAAGDAKAEARLAKFSAITGLKDYPTITAAQRTVPLTKLPDRLLGSWRAVDLVGEAPEQERARLIRLEIDGSTANFSTDIDLYHRSAAGAAPPAGAPATGATAAGAPGARAPATRLAPSRCIVRAFSCGGGAAASYLVTNDPSGAAGALITCGANGTLVVTAMTRSPFALNAQDCTVYRIVK